MVPTDRRRGQSHRPSFWPVGQFLTRQTSIVRSFCVAVLAIAAGALAAACDEKPTPNPAVRGGAIVASLRTDSMMVNGKPLKVAAPDAQTVVVTFPAPFAPGIRLLDNIPMLPKHRLEAALKAGTFASAWSLTTPPADIVGLGPFVLKEYVPGQRLVFARNPHYWRKDASGTPLPYLDQVTADVIPDESAEVLRLESGQIDMTFSSVAPESYALVKRAADAGRIKVMDLGVAYDADSFWLNLKPGAFAADPRAAWLQRDELRRAISMAVDRQLFADTVFLGAGVPVFGPVTPSNKKWYAADAPHAA